MGRGKQTEGLKSQEERKTRRIYNTGSQNRKVLQGECIKSYELAKKDEDSDLTVKFRNIEIIHRVEKNWLGSGRDVTGVNSKENDW